jgi:hypothetical protein
MEENPYQSPSEASLPQIALETSATRGSRVIGFGCFLVVTACAFIASQLEPRPRDFPAYVFISLNALAWTASGCLAFAKKRRAFYISLLFNGAAFLAGVVLFGGSAY